MAGEECGDGYQGLADVGRPLAWAEGAQPTRG